MMALFDQEKAVEQFGYEKKQEGREEGRIRQAKKTAINMLKDGESMDKIAKFLEIPIHLIQSWAKEVWQSMMALFDQEKAVEQFGYEKM